MKCRFLILSLCLLLPAMVNAQNILSVNGKNVDELYIDVSWETWLNPPDNIDMERARQRGITFSSLFRLDGGDNKLGIAPGIGFSSANINTNTKRWSFNENGNLKETFDNPDYRKNKVVLSYLEIPIELQYRTKKDDKDCFKVSLGVKGGWLVDLHTKLKQDNGNKIKQKFRSPFRDYQYGTYLRMGHDNLFLFGHLGISSVFDANNAPETQSLSIGLTWSGI